MAEFCGEKKKKPAKNIHCYIDRISYYIIVFVSLLFCYCVNFDYTTNIRTYLKKNSLLYVIIAYTRIYYGFATVKI